MSRKFQMKRGAKANLPTLAVAEPAFTTDEGKMYVGSDEGNVAMARDDHTHTPASIGAAAKTHYHTLAQVSDTETKKASYRATAVTADGVAYTATVDGITELYIGLTITIIPNLQSATRTPTLNVNGLGAIRMVMPINGSNTSSTTQPPVVYNDETTEDELNSKMAVASKWLTASKPVTVRYDGTYWETDIVAQSATCLYGTVPIESGGTNAKTAAEARTNLGITPANIGAAASSHKQDASTITAGTFAGQVVANSSGQTPTTSLLRNSSLVSAETNPTVNGEICWTYE